MPFLSRPDHRYGPLPLVPSRLAVPSAASRSASTGITSPAITASATAAGALLGGRAFSPAPPTTGYAVVDLETTGLSPTSDDILEIGVVLLDADGNEESSWSTLVSPAPGQRVPTGPTWIHGIEPEDLLDAPGLDEVADALVESLRGRVAVAHNARFDLGFLSHALARLGKLAPGTHIPRVCTMEWARHFIDTPSRRLTTCCEVAGVELSHHHAALDDARASAGLLRHYMGVAQARGEALPWERVRIQAAQLQGWMSDDEQARSAFSRLKPRSAGVPRVR